MTKDKVLSMARACGMDEKVAAQLMIATDNPMADMLVALVEMAVVEERHACGLIAAEYGPSRPIATPNPSQNIIGRWEGEQAASRGIADAIWARRTHAPGLMYAFAAGMAAEREACAQVCDRLAAEVDKYPSECAAAIRARKDAPWIAPEGAEG